MKLSWLINDDNNTYAWKFMISIIQKSQKALLNLNHCPFNPTASKMNRSHVVNQTLSKRFVPDYPQSKPIREM